MTAALVALTPSWMLGQICGPVCLAEIWLIAFVPALLLTLVVVKTRTMPAAILCGLAFSVPPAIYCWVLPTLESQFIYYVKDVRLCGTATIVISIVLMVLATFHRQLDLPSDNDGDIAKKN